ncbi:serine O-acetyltransferase, partial [Aeromonas enteropelogenes]
MDDLVAKTWQKIQQEALCMAAEEPMLASFFHSTILNHKNLRSALSFQLA